MHLSQDQWNSYVLAKIKVWCVKLFHLQAGEAVWLRQSWSKSSVNPGSRGVDGEQHPVMLQSVTGTFSTIRAASLKDAVML